MGASGKQQAAVRLAVRKMWREVAPRGRIFGAADCGHGRSRGMSRGFLLAEHPSPPTTAVAGGIQVRYWIGSDGTQRGRISPLAIFSLPPLNFLTMKPSKCS